MKSVSRDPFAVEPLPKAYYYPSPERQLSRTQKTTAINPSRPAETKTRDHPQKDESVSPMDEIFLQGTNSFQTKPAYQDTADDDDLDESWPASERPSSLSLTGLEEGESPAEFARFQSVIDRFAGLKLPDTRPTPQQASTRTQPHHGNTQMPLKRGAPIHTKSDKTAKSKLPQRVQKKTAVHIDKEPKHTDDNLSGSVLQRYIERFRNSAPMSREERDRQQQSSSRDFWWLSPGQRPGEVDRPGPGMVKGGLGPGKVGQETSGEEEYQPAVPLTEENLHKYSQWEQKSSKRAGMHTVAESPGDKKTIELQERAERLLEKSSSTVLSGDPAVSTEGLGSTMSDMSTLEEYPYRPAFTAYIERDRVPARRAERSRGPGFKPPGGPERSGPDDDPLQQWRLRRRMEKAQEAPAKHSQTFDFLDKSEKQRQVDEQLEEFKRKLSGKSGPGGHVQVTATAGEFTPAPHLTQNDGSSYQRPGPAPRQPQIASPVLQRAGSRLQQPSVACTERNQEVDPHLHLLCDLLPCPHQAQYTDQLYTDQLSQVAQHADTHTDLNTQETHKTDKPAKTEYDRLSEVDKRTQYLQAEKPDVEQVIDNKSGNENRKDKLESDGEMSDVSESRRTKSKHKDKRREGQQGRQKGERDDRTERGSRCGSREEKRSGDVAADREHSDKEEREDGRRSSKGERVLKPSRSSSPKVEGRGLDQAIGQVVKNHLFSMSTSTVLSSVESLPPPSASLERLPPPRGAQHLSSLPEHPHGHTDDSDDSDGEFGEDQLLQMLRRQRSMFEGQLQEIDHLLADLESR